MFQPWKDEIRTAWNFHEVSVWSLKAALEAAYQAGLENK